MLTAASAFKTFFHASSFVLSGSDVMGVKG